MGKTKKQDDGLDPRQVQVGEKLKILRVKKGYASYEQFAFDHELPRSGYGEHEKGRNMTLASLIRLLDIHEISMREFFKDLK